MRKIEEDVLKVLQDDGKVRLLRVKSWLGGRVCPLVALSHNTVNRASSFEMCFWERV